MIATNNTKLSQLSKKSRDCNFDKKKLLQWEKSYNSYIVYYVSIVLQWTDSQIKHHL